MADLITMLQAAAGASTGGGGYQISRSLRFNSADSAYLNRTPASASNRKTWTWSGWVKRSFPDGITDSTNRTLFSAGDSNPWFQLDFSFFNGGVGNIEVSFTAGTSGGSSSSAIFRDFSAWYHVVLAVDTTQATDSNRIKLYVNGIQQTFSSTNYPSQNFDTQVNNNIAHYIGRANAANYLNGYLTEVHFIDGQALTPSSFGETNATTGVWSPIEYTGTYGTNGFYLDFSDNTSTTTLGEDQAGSNNWTPNNFSVTAGAGNDSLVDTPTQFGTDTGAGGEVRGNYCTLNPLDANSGLTIRNGNLEATTTTQAQQAVRSTIGVSSGKWYWECVLDAFGVGNTAITIGIGTNAASLSTQAGTEASSYGWYSDGGGSSLRYLNSQSSENYGTVLANGVVCGVAMDLDAGTLTFYRNNVSQGVAYTGITSGTYFPLVTFYNSTGTVNFGQRPFAYTAPSGFKALVTTNLPTPTVVQGDDYFNTVLYTGTGASQSITGVGFQPDWVWIKERNASADHGLYDAVRGTTKQLESNNTDAETTEATGLTAFGSDGFTVGALAQLNTSADTYVAWNWNAGGSNATNTDGTITSTVRANPTAGFSIVSYTGTGSAATLGHGLGAVPRMIIVKNRDAADAWQVYHAANTANPETDYLVLNTDAATADAADRWNDTLPTSTLFSIGNGVEVNTNTEKYVAYCFAAIPGYSAFGSYTGNGSTDGPFVFTGFRPAFVMIKSFSGIADHWNIFDDTRTTFNVINKNLKPNLANAEATDASILVDFVSNGFKLRQTDGQINGNTFGYIYMAFAESPFKFALAR